MSGPATRESFASGPAPYIMVRGLTVALDGQVVLEDVSFEIGTGELFGLVGPNGAGKTTLLRALGRMVPCHRGTIVIAGRDLAHYRSRELAALVASVPQRSSASFPFRCGDLVLMGRHPHLGRFQMEGEHDRALVRQAMQLTETTELADRAVTETSGGERQRVLIARALAQEPQLLLLDEPTSDLDIRHQVAVLGLVRRLTRQGMTAVAAIHDLNLAGRYCDRLALLDRGRFLVIGRPWEVLSKDHLEAAYGIPVAVHPDPVTGTPLVVPVPDDQAEGVGPCG
ncbi:MAG: ABC transporter ATP-binding protein [Deltaproteobacteria bacterium]|nr:ABC transporter ATP-binding protein [Deltaproteobacteria bacterium]